jgi:hypothetical protein
MSSVARDTKVLRLKSSGSQHYIVLYRKKCCSLVAWAKITCHARFAVSGDVPLHRRPRGPNPSVEKWSECPVSDYSQPNMADFKLTKPCTVRFVPDIIFHLEKFINLHTLTYPIRFAVTFSLLHDTHTITFEQIYLGT